MHVMTQVVQKNEVLSTFIKNDFILQYFIESMKLILASPE
jgi:hypothetical protein